MNHTSYIKAASDCFVNKEDDLISYSVNNENILVKRDFQTDAGLISISYQHNNQPNFIPLSLISLSYQGKESSINISSQIKAHSAISLIYDNLISFGVKKATIDALEFLFLDFVGRVNNFINIIGKSNKPIEACVDEWACNWKMHGMDELFNDIDNKSSTNFAIEWLAEGNNTISTQMSNAGFEETLYMLNKLQPEFISKLKNRLTKQAS